MCSMPGPMMRNAIAECCMQVAKKEATRVLTIAFNFAASSCKHPAHCCDNAIAHATEVIIASVEKLVMRRAKEVDES